MDLWKLHHVPSLDVGMGEDAKKRSFRRAAFFGDRIVWAGRLVKGAGHVGTVWEVPRCVGGRGPASALLCLRGGGLQGLWFVAVGRREK